MYLFVSLMSIGAMAQSKTVKGIVSQDGIPLSGVTVTVSDSEASLKSSKDGVYKVKANVGDVITYTYPGMKTFDVIVEDVTNTLNIGMAYNITELDEVVVRKNKLKDRVFSSRDYDENKTFLKTTFGTVDLAKWPTVVRFLDGDRITPGNLCIVDVFKMYFPGANVNGSCFGEPGEVNFQDSAIRTDMTSQAVIYDVDGVIFTEIPLWLNPRTIKRMAFLSGGGGAAQYGALGGAIVINTENSYYGEDKNLNPNYDRAKLTNNIYQNDAVAVGKTMDKNSIYLTQLLNAKNLDDAKVVYESNAKLVANSYHFVLDAMQYFMDTHRDFDYAQAILENNYAVFETNPVALKSLAYLYDVANLNKSANQVYKDIFMLRPSYGQSYLDLADSYRDMGAYRKSAAMFSRLDYLKDQEFLKTSETFTNITDREFNNLIALKGSKVVSDNNSKPHVMEEDFKGTRLVFEWADSEAEFDIQFVNPENRYEIWNHSLAKNQERITEGKTVGYNTQEYFIDDALKGTWQVNMKYLGNKTLTPSYVKATVYHNYGSASQRKESTLFKLQKENMNQNLLRIENSSFIVSR